MSSDWTDAQQKALETALRKYPTSMEKAERWKLIGEAVPGKSTKACAARCRELAGRAKKSSSRTAEPAASSADPATPERGGGRRSRGRGGGGGGSAAATPTSGGGGGGGEAAEAVALWAFIRKMLTHIRSAPESAVASAGIPLAAVEAEVARMRERFGELQLPVVLGHGDLKPSNVMAGAAAPPPGADEAVSFIDFELAGACPPRAILRKSAQFCAILRNPLTPHPSSQARTTAGTTCTSCSARAASCRSPTCAPSCALTWTRCAARAT